MIGYLGMENKLKENHPAEIKKRSVVIAGHRTSVSLENIFWDMLRLIATRENLSINQMVTSIDSNRNGNLSSAIRTHVLLAFIPS